MIASLCLSIAPALGLEPLPQEQSAPPASAKTSPFSYTFGQIDFVRGDGDGYSDGPDGFNLHGSYGLKDNLFLFGGLGLMSGDVGAADPDTNELELGLGYHMPLSPAADFVMGGSLLYANTDSGGAGSSYDGGGWSLRAGVRYNANEQFELDGTLGITDYSGSNSNTWLEFGGVFHATPNLGLCATLMTSDDIDTLSLGIRFQP